mgnify:CR=1 FL=1
MAAVIFGLGMGMAMTSSYALVADISPPRVRSHAMGTTSSFLHAGIAIGATLMGLVAGMSSYETMFRVCALCMAIGLLVVWLLLRGQSPSHYKALYSN